MVDGGVKGSIVCTASVTASKGTDEVLDYTMSKHAVLDGIRVNCVSPSVLGTPLSCAIFETDTEGVEKKFSSSSNLKGLALKVNHVADAVLFLASNESAFVSGHNLAVDGAHRPC
ncbi:hypothetical protein BVC80_1831g96 [Macleaya cordata]|uniref:Short-chain dehydrogenase/reductase SDR n=1 Tax=Macleaya cordata TaxID=56857 RepID=A0A200R758_MACCD|nr:hypothetical protein BVC80_1831g96 [Macleaya cordata]